MRRKVIKEQPLISFVAQDQEGTNLFTFKNIPASKAKKRIKDFFDLKN